jgi:hypothetical protein
MVSTLAVTAALLAVQQVNPQFGRTQDAGDCPKATIWVWFQ